MSQLAGDEELLVCPEASVLGPGSPSDLDITVTHEQCLPRSDPALNPRLRGA